MSVSTAGGARWGDAFVEQIRRTGDTKGLTSAPIARTRVSAGPHFGRHGGSRPPSSRDRRTRDQAGFTRVHPSRRGRSCRNTFDRPAPTVQIEERASLAGRSDEGGVSATVPGLIGRTSARAPDFRATTEALGPATVHRAGYGDRPPIDVRPMDFSGSSEDDPPAPGRKEHEALPPDPRP